MDRAYGPHKFSVTETPAVGLGWYSDAPSALVFAQDDDFVAALKKNIPVG